jgi:hypothetical protein
MRRLINAALGADRAWLQLRSATRAFHNSPGIVLPPEEERARDGSSPKWDGKRRLSVAWAMEIARSPESRIAIQRPAFWPMLD